eukprot:TRINITY_DN3303_c0_g1_i2.p1 TRINITY_DN3303_c0_g1~~TRINITY_DN3303_c0_g1_i2.p1  ORF type:complete len:328 (-),score=22.58 TRINITY_DN3303_c0_g1_i2:199-1182(-)
MSKVLGGWLFCLLLFRQIDVGRAHGWPTPVFPPSYELEQRVEMYHEGLKSDPKNKDTAFLFFLHMPKAGGSTFRMNLISYCKENDLLVLGNSDNLLLMPQREQIKHYALWGHWSFGMHLHANYKLMGHRNIFYLTILREPISRALSRFWFAVHRKTEDRPAFRKCLDAGDITCYMVASGFLQRADRWNIIKNPAVGQLTRWGRPSFTTPKISDVKTQMKIAYMNGTGIPQWGTRKDLELAKRRLDSMPVVGITSRMVETCRLANKVFDIDLECAHGKRLSVNVHSHPRTMPPVAQKIAEEGLKLDIELYEHAVKRFEYLLKLHSITP